MNHHPKSKQIIPDIEFVQIPTGTFQMGDVRGEGDDDEKPVHTVSVHGFLLGAATVTFAQYDCFCEATGFPKPSDQGWGQGDRPAINITWFEAVAFCLWLSHMTGRTIRLPTEIEWEYAARQGGENVRFGNGANLARSTEINFDARAAHREPYSEAGEYRDMTLPVRTFAPNRLGLYHMSGNIWEWCSTKYTPSYDREFEVIEVWSPEEKSSLLEGSEPTTVGGPDNPRIVRGSELFRVDALRRLSDASRPLRVVVSFGQCPALRGGAFDTYPRNVRATLRGWDNARTHSPNRGLRVVSELG